MSRRRGISAEELDQIIKIKGAGASWLKIQEESGVPRRTAKAAYEKWQQSKSIIELREARVNVATELFRAHINALVNLAGYVTANLSLPTSWQVKADDFMTSLLENEISGQIPFYDLPQTNDRHREKSTLHSNRLLLKALQEHTKDEVRWGALNDWKATWDDFIASLGNARKTISDFVLQEAKKRKKIFARIKGEGGNEDAIGCIADTIVEAFRRYAVEDDFTLDKPLVRVASVNSGTAYAVIRRTDDDVIFRFNDRLLAEELEDIIDAVTTSFEVLNTMRGEDAEAEFAVKKMRSAIAELDSMLTPVALYPVLLRTKCSYCPA